MAEEVESFVVRVYRRNHKKAHSVAGIVEKVGKEVKQGFEDGNELLEILSGKNKPLTLPSPLRGED
jgi:hypothetical protein